MEHQPWREAVSNPDDCARYEAYLTALFDGEATPEEAGIARAHLTACDDCSFLWKQWDDTRYLLVSTPQPAVPATLLLRILMACRLLSLPRRRRVQDATSVQLQVAEAMPILPAYRDDIAPRPSREVPVPPDMVANILGRTTLAGGPAASDANAMFRMKPPIQGDSSLLHAGLKVPYRRVNRFATAIAVPALAAWFFVSMHRLPHSSLSWVRPDPGKTSNSLANFSPTLAATRNVVQNPIDRHQAASKSVTQAEVEPQPMRDTYTADRSPLPANDIPGVQTASIRESAPIAVVRTVAMPALDSGTHAQTASAVASPLMSWHADKVHLATDNADAPSTRADQPDATPVAVPEAPAPLDDDQNDVPSAGDTRPVAISHVVDDFRASLIDDAHDDTDDNSAG